MRQMGRWLFWRWFDVGLNRYIFHEDIRKKPNDLDLWPFDFKFALTVIYTQGHVFVKLEICMVCEI